MNRITQTFSISICAFSLSACMIDGTNTTYDYHHPLPQQSTLLYPDSYETVGMYNTEPVITDTTSTTEQHNVVVPESYHVGAYRAPTTSKDADRTWVTSQNPQGYTIELASGDKAASVASVLYKAPKKEHMAEVKYQHGGKTYYRGLYGSYTSYEAAQQTLNALPDEIKKNAGIKTWNSIQGSISE